MNQTRKTADLDRAIGGKIRERRIMLGLTQDELARQVCVTYQQMHKYERGINRCSAGRLLEIARALAVSISYFYEGLDEGQLGPSPRERLTLELARNFAAIPNAAHQDALSTMARALAGAA